MACCQRGLRRSSSIARAVGFTVAALALGPERLAAQPQYELLHTFAEAPSHPVGRYVEGASGVFYGNTFYGGAFDRGAVVALSRDSGGTFTHTTLHSFNGSDGARPYSGLVKAADGNFYGLTSEGGAAGF